MSRATVDLQSIRFFLGYGFVFIAQSALTILFAAVGDVRAAPGAGGAGAGARCRSSSWSPSATGSARGRRSRRSSSGSRELTAEAEENVSGVRVVKAFAAEPRQLERFRGTVRRVFDQSMYSTRLSAFYQPFIGFLPSSAWRRSCSSAAAQRDRRHADAGRLHGVLRLPADADRADALARHRARLRPARDRVGRAAVRDPRPRAAARVAAGRAAAARGQRARGAADVSFAYEDGPPVLRDIDLASTAAPRSRWSARPARASRRSCRCSARNYDVTGGSVLIDGADVRDVELNSLRRADRRRRPTTRSCSAPASTTTSPTGGRTPPARRSSGRPSARRRRASSPSCPTATTPWSASAG